MKWQSGKPASLAELFDFYHNYVKVLYSSVQVQNELPQEVLFELNAALDHISRKWVYDEPEQDVVAKAYGHLKRCCLDIFKLKVKEAREQYDQLLKIDTSLLDNGQFDAAFHSSWSDIKKSAIESRRLEGKTEDDDSVPAFDMWEDVYLKCLAFEKECFNHPGIEWANRKASRQLILTRISGLFCGAMLSYVVWCLQSVGNHWNWVGHALLALTVLSVVFEWKGEKILTRFKRWKDTQK